MAALKIGDETGVSGYRRVNLEGFKDSVTFKDNFRDICGEHT
jgi:hypothetical protein